MDLINWSLNAIDTLFSTRSLGSGEPECPGGTFPAGYTMDEYRAGLSIEDAEDIYLFGTMIRGFLLIGAGLALAYRRIKKVEPAVETMGRGATSQNGLIESSTVKTLETLTAAVNTRNNNSERILGYIKERPAQNNTLERKLDCIAEQLTAVVSSQNRLFGQKNENTNKLDTIIGKATWVGWKII